jgi:hypothetical protein
MRERTKLKEWIATTALFIAVLGAACSDNGSGSGTDSGTDSGTNENFTIAEKLSAIDTGGDTSAEADEFQEVLDCIQASGIEGGETEREIADTLVAAWDEMGKPEGGLLELGQALCSG